jgi:hypothetical protein
MNKDMDLKELEELAEDKHIDIIEAIKDENRKKEFRTDILNSHCFSNG